MDIPDHPDTRRRVLQGLAGLTGAGLMGAGTGAPSTGQGALPTRPSAASQPGFVDPRSLGARMDAATDDAEALRLAARSGRVVLIDGSLRIDQVVDLPPEAILQGTGVFRARIVLGPRGRLRVSGESFTRRMGGGVIRDLTICPPDEEAGQLGLELRHIEHFLFDNVTFYHVGLLLDDHHNVSFRDCRLFGGDRGRGLSSNCASQPTGHVAISETPCFDRCFFSDYPVEFEDTVGTRFTDCVVFAGAFGVRSRRRMARGNEVEPFFMGPTFSGCTFDSINGSAIDIEGGGTDCRLVNNFISGGRSSKAPGVRLTNASGVELIGNRFEWCGTAGLVLERCEKIGIVGNSFANIAAGPAVAAQGSRGVRVIGNVFENQRRWGGSGAGGTTLALDCDAGCGDWVVTANTATALRDARVSTLANSLVSGNGGWPAATEGGWPAGPGTARPRGVADGYRWYDQTLGLWIHWHRGSGRWRDPAGRAV